jgi:maltose/maltodextrin transport system permease protein
MSRAAAASSPWLRHAITAAVALAALYGVMGVYASGNTLLAVVLLVVSALALWAYTSPRTGALRYLLPGIATALVFVIFPMLYTFGLGFTNYSARNLLSFEQVTQQLREESLRQPDSERVFTLHVQGTQWRVQLAATATQPALATGAISLTDRKPQTAALQPLADAAALGDAAPLRAAVAHLPALRSLRLQTPEGAVLTLGSLREFAQAQPLYEALPDGGLHDRITGTVYQPDAVEGFYTSQTGEQLQPGYRVNVGWRHYARIFHDGRFSEPFASVFVWTVVFSALTVLFTTALGLLLAVLLNWESLEGRPAYRLVLFLPYAVPGFISILVFKGLFNQNLGEINLILHGLFGVKPAWFSDPFLAKTMLLIVNTWLGFPYMMVLCSGLTKSIPADLYEASAVAGAGPWVNFSRITLPLILKPMTPLLISAFAFNFNNFVLISLLTGGLPDQLGTSLPAGTTDILVSYTWRIAFQDSGQQFGLASAISTVIFLIVVAITLVQMRFTRINDEPKR